ncbi:sugar ABC transporter ATP-binding protein [Rodentibacter pneumotropicus]|uniref:Ribose/galactose/methyl galactoside import ATP-binding protein n=3 Tax=Rodentibacter pneumotropicus TaxID=758 RepID=A0A4S2PBF7_9PAST|nr:sugar ABC transporter ATP-binding protein [Rodentibacter pneumotropicus]MDC2825517.1 sugar ABC transporter ATP-binding protein [Rodentibacter pneumotropicus]NBH75174.1 sugar ABC transporter ATP-binding protein [Rodentibacter pneumotropicus]OOF60341.1 D-ribose transporter ATP-binding protein [Rodentibacter pneumotropicus]OOF60635.1 D-ribose transporter ATP-binding protein [Rodentibacter pneumotropicus]THA00508.1 sugar ABC transporter ATP-binding protein [Rodentibacter pneumotropicus]
MANNSNSPYILEMRNVSKTFPGVKALDGINLRVRRGSIHALMGENGAGKSTLMKILYGIYIPDEGGEIILDEKPFKPNRPIDAIRCGLTMVPQEISPAANLTIADNFYLGREITQGKFFLDQKTMNKQTSAILKDLGVPMDVTTKMSDVSVAKAQLVAIATAVSNDAKVIIMDEPTTALTENEVEQLYRIIETVKARGIAIIFISHKLDEVFRVSDEITVIRDGQYVDTKPTKEVSKEQLISMMVGRDMSEMFQRERFELSDEIALEIKNFTRAGYYQDINFSVRKGEIFGIAGLVGAGRSEIVEGLFGYKPADSGEIYIKGEKTIIHNPLDAMKYKIGFVTEDRKLTGLFLNLSITDNMIMPKMSPYLENLLVSVTRAQKTANEQKIKLKIKAPNVQVMTNNLSGGNQQKVLLARWLLLEPDILILDEPTKGIDVGAKAELYKLMVELSKQGKTIIMITSDMLELLSMSDRVMVMHEGRQVGIIPHTELTQERVLELASG